MSIQIANISFLLCVSHQLYMDTIQSKTFAIKIATIFCNLFEQWLFFFLDLTDAKGNT